MLVASSKEQQVTSAGHTRLVAAGATIARNFVSLAAGRLGSQLLGLVTNGYLARRISVEGFGTVGLAQAVTTYLNIFSDAGLSVIAMREGSQDPARLQPLLRSVSALRILLGTACMVTGLVCAGFLPFSETARQMVRLFALSLPLQAVLVDWVFRALQQMHVSALLQILGAAATLALTFTFVRGAGDALRVPLIALAVAALSGCASVLAVARFGLRYGLEFDMGAFRRHLSASMPLCASSLAITLYIQANYLILGALRGEQEVGLYAAAAKLTSALSAVHWLYYAAMAPTLMSLYAQSKPQATRLLHESLRLTSGLGLGACVVGVSAATELMSLVFGPEFRAGGAVLSLMLFSAAVVAIGHNWAQLVIAAKHERLLLFGTLAGGVCNLATCALLVRPFGALGAALANLLAEIAVHVCLLLFCWNRLRVGEIQAIRGPAVAALAGLITAGALPREPLGRVLLGAFVYLVFLIATGGIRPADVRTFKTAWKGRAGVSQAYGCQR